jgi:hypothetical protein
LYLKALIYGIELSVGFFLFHWRQANKLERSQGKDKELTNLMNAASAQRQKKCRMKFEEY